MMSMKTIEYFMNRYYLNTERACYVSRTMAHRYQIEIESIESRPIVIYTSCRRHMRLYVPKRPSHVYYTYVKCMHNLLML